MALDTTSRDGCLPSESWPTEEPSWCESPSSESDNGLWPGEELFGQDEFSERKGLLQDRLIATKKLLANGHQPTAAAVLSACVSCEDTILHELLIAGADPNARRQCMTPAETGSDAWNRAWSDDTLEENQEATVADRRVWYAIQFVAQEPWSWRLPHSKDSEELQEQARETRRQTLHLLLDHGVDVYRTYKEALWPTLPFPFPGQGRDPVESQWDWSCSLPESEEIWDVFDFDGTSRSVPTPYAGYIPRCVIHALFEDGGLVDPFFKNKTFTLDIERRDPLGRTIMHAACRRHLGGDSPITAVSDDLLSNHSWDRASPPFDTNQSVFHTLRLLGADMSALDNSGRTVLHHLLEARCQLGPPFIRNSILCVLSEVPHLTNKAHHRGTYPIHSALQRLRHYSAHHGTGPRAAIERSEDVVFDLLAAGADPLLRDGRGNTTLHYLAECGLTQRDDSQKVRELATYLCTAGVDVNARNSFGTTVLEIVFAESRELTSRRRSPYMFAAPPHYSEQDIQEQVFDMLDEAGAQWKSQNADGQTLLHVVAQNLAKHGGHRAEYLMQKGVDLITKDKQGRTAADLAQACGNAEFLLYIDRDGPWSSSLWRDRYLPNNIFW